MVVFPITIDGRPAIAEMKGVEAESDKLVKALGSVASAVDRLETQMKEQAAAAKGAAAATNEETKATEKNEQATKDAAAAKTGQRVAVQRTREEMRRAAEENHRYERSVDGVRRGLMGARGAMLGLLAVGGLALGAQGAVRLLGDYSEKTAILGVVSRATAADQAILQRQALSLGESTRYTASQAVDAQIALARAGLQVNEVLGATPAVLALATVGEVGLGDAATYVANSLRQFSIDASQANRVGDGLVIVSNRANTDVRQMAEALAYAGPVAKAAGRSFEETAAAIGVLGDAGLTGSMAGTNVRGMLSDLLSRNDVTERALARMGLTFEQVNPLTNDFVGLLETLNRRGFGAAEAIEIFGDRNAAAALVLANNTTKLRELIEAQRTYSGEARSGAEVIEKSLKGAYLGLASAAEGAILKQGDQGLTGTLRGIITTGTDAIRVLFGLSREQTEVGTSGKVVAVAIEALAGGLAAMTALKVISGVRALAAGLALMSSPLTLAVSPATVFAGAVVGLGVAASATHGIFNVWNDSLERNRLQIEESRKAAEGFRASFEGIDAAVRRVTQASGDAAKGLMFGRFGGRVAESLFGLPRGAVDFGMSPSLQGAQVREREGLLSSYEGLLATLRSNTSFSPASDAGRPVAEQMRALAERQLGRDAAARAFERGKQAELAAGIPGFERMDYNSQIAAGNQLTERAEVAGLRSMVEAAVERLRGTLQADREILARIAEAARGRERDFAQESAAATATKELQEQIGLLEKRRDLLAAGDVEGLRLLDAQGQFSDQVAAAGQQAAPLIERIAALNGEILALGSAQKATVRETNQELREQVQHYDRIWQYIGELYDQRRLFGLTPDAREIEQATLELRREGASEGQIAQARELLSELQSLRRIESVAFGIGDALAGGLERAVFQGGKLRDLVNATLLDIYRVGFRQLVSQPVAGGVGAGLSGLFGSIFGSGSDGPIGPPRADGSFAAGGLPELITRPTYFPMRGGRTGRAGESGPEVAIAPLRRTSRGELGVAIADGGGARGGDTIMFNMTFNGVPDGQTAQLAAARVRTQMERALRDRRGPRS